MGRADDRRLARELGARPEPPGPRKAVGRLKVTPRGVVARICAVAALACMFLPWLSAPGMNVVARFSWMFGLYIVPGDMLFPMYGTGEMASLLDTVTESAGMYGSVWAVFLIAWAAAVLLLAVRFVQSVVGLRDSRRLVLPGFLSGGVATAWGVAVVLLNLQYVSLLQPMFGAGFTMFQIPPAVFAVAVLGFVCGILSRRDRQPYLSK